LFFKILLINLICLVRRADLIQDEGLGTKYNNQYNVRGYIYQQYDRVHANNYGRNTNYDRRDKSLTDADLLDPVFNEILDIGIRNNSKRGALDLYKMVKCGTGCNPLVYKGYGCYCGFLGSGGVVDGIDRCCKMHDWCYTRTSCMHLEHSLPYFVPYKWTCNGGAPYCIAGNSRSTGSSSCGHQLCECDREFVECLSEFPCPRKKAMCRSPWRYWQNLFMGLGTGMEMDDSHYNSIHGAQHRFKPKPRIEYPEPIFSRGRLNVEFGRP